MIGPSRRRLLYAAAVGWIVLTLSLATWWLVFGLLQSRHPGAPEVEPAEVARVQRMLVAEGVVFIALIVAGGAGLFVAVRRERDRAAAVESFFLAFTHDLKTALASLTLQVESLREDLPEAAGNPNLERLLDDTRRLGVQLENSLYFAQPHGNLLIERIAVPDAIRRTSDDWPELDVSVEGDATALGDRRAFEIILRNLFQNAVVHGRATAMAIHVANGADGHVEVTARDNGAGASRELLPSLGRAMARRGSTAGAGVGLFVSAQLARRMRGDLRFTGSAGAGFTAVISLPRTS